jgi:glycine/D-amino acid oxidase-like deaminating enzyme
METQMSNTSRSHGLWEASAPPPPKTQTLEHDIAADAIIIGGGFTGCSAALHLAVAGKKAVILEGQTIGFGGSGRNVGLVNAGLWVMPDDIASKLPEPFGERLLTQLSEAPRLVIDLVDRFGINCQLQRSGTLHCAAGAAGYQEIAERARQWLRRGADVELIDAERAASLIGSKAYSGALLDRRAGTIQPLAYVHGLATAAIQAGASIYTHSPVLNCSSVSGLWKVTTPSGSVTAPAVVFATDAYSTHESRQLRAEQVMLPYFNLATKPLPLELRKSILPQNQGVWDTKKILSSFRLDRDNRLIFGSVGALRGPGTAIHKSWARRELARIFPQLHKIQFEYEWYGMIGMTEDAIPRFHQHGRNCWSISGYNGRGIAPGTTFGRDLAGLMLGSLGAEDLALPLTQVRSAPFRQARAAFFEFGAEVAHLTGSRL